MNKERRITDSEMSILKNTFAEDDALLKLLRKVFFKVKLTADEKKKVAEVLTGKSVLDVLKKIFLPTISTEVPLGQNIDLFMSINLENKDDEQVERLLSARYWIIDNIETGLKAIETGEFVEEKDITTFECPSDLDRYTYLIARNTFITHTEQSLLQIKFLAGEKTESVEQTLERLNKNSAK